MRTLLVQPSWITQSKKSDFKTVDRFSDKNEYNLKDNNFEMQFFPSKELTPDIGQIKVLSLTPCEDEDTSATGCTYPP